MTARRGGGEESSPAPATIFRLGVWDEASAQLVLAAKKKLAPLLNLRDGGKIRRIQAAQSAEELIDLAPQALGLAQDAWHARMRSFGAEGAAQIAAVLPEIHKLEDENVRRRITHLLLSELRWQGSRGLEALDAVWEQLDDTSAGLGCVVFGILEAQHLTERVWSFYREMEGKQTGRLDRIGALWGLLDLGDARLAGQLDSLLRLGDDFYELYGFLARAGTERSLGPLLERAMQPDLPRRTEAWLAAAGIARRCGREAAVDALWAYAGSEPGERDQAAEVVALLFSPQADGWQEAFALYFRGFQPGDVQNVLAELG